MAVDPQLVADLKRDEGRVGRQTPGGFVHMAYPDPLSPRAVEMRRLKIPLTQASDPRVKSLSGAPWTIGYGNTGRFVYEGLEWTEAQAQAELEKDVEEHNAFLDRVLPWISSLDPVRRRVLYNMHFNMGWDNPRTPQLEGLSGFTRTLEAIRAGRYADAAEKMGQSLWARQVGGRAVRLAEEMRTGRYAAKTGG